MPGIIVILLQDSIWQRQGLSAFHAMCDWLRNSGMTFHVCAVLDKTPTGIVTDKRFLLRVDVERQSKTGVSTPRTLCSLGDVVVYCMWIFFSGKIYGAAPNAARAASWKPDRISFFLPG